MTKTAISAPEKGEPLIIDELACWLEKLIDGSFGADAVEAEKVLKKYKEKYEKRVNKEEPLP